ncbi:excalibur calcium-binding domain-containing protein [Nocardioides ferulae]|uniref:excalibur calcium-binding domain-containing protein n=1 Tax=Nocardioides ferulae TaxID=2340821 RepID=UPI000EB1131D|nr:excalibur calcium-binding domain-containing protein [Nocardioides ferulae]
MSSARAVRAALLAATTTVSMLAVAGPAQAVTDYANCDALHQDYKYGVAKSKAAANKQVRTGHYRPAVKPAVYAVNDESDADKDGTACEVTR